MEFEQKGRSSKISYDGRKSLENAAHEMYYKSIYLTGKKHRSCTQPSRNPGDFGSSK
jgi:hypothetical protein